MKTPETEELIEATQKCIESSKAFIEKMRRDVRYDQKHLADIRRIMHELNTALAHKEKPEDQDAG